MGINRQKQKEEKELEIVRRLLEKGKNQKENIQENITHDILRHAIRDSRLRIGMDGVLRYVNYKRHSSSKKALGTKEEWLVVLPKVLRRRFLLVVNNMPASGHIGQERTWQRARQSVWWPDLKQDVQKYVRGCNKCQLHKRPNHPKRAPLLNTDIPAHPLDKVQIDFCGPFQKSISEGYQYVLAMQDVFAMQGVFSKFCLLVPTKDCKAETAVQVVMDRWVCQFGVPMVMQFDQGPTFTAELFKEMCRQLGVAHRISSPKSPSFSRSSGETKSVAGQCTMCNTGQVNFVA